MGVTMSLAWDSTAHDSFTTRVLSIRFDCDWYGACSYPSRMVPKSTDESLRRDETRVVGQRSARMDVKRGIRLVTTMPPNSQRPR